MWGQALDDLLGGRRVGKVGIRKRDVGSRGVESNRSKSKELLDPVFPAFEASEPPCLTPPR